MGCRLDLLVPSPIERGVGRSEVGGLQSQHDDMALDQEGIEGIKSGPSKDQLQERRGVGSPGAEGGRCKTV